MAHSVFALDNTDPGSDSEFKDRDTELQQEGDEEPCGWIGFSAGTPKGSQ